MQTLSRNLSLGDKKFILRKAAISDLNQIMLILADARVALGKLGIDQWQDGKPTHETILKTIQDKTAYVAMENNNIVGFAVLFIGNDPDYKSIKGKWQSDEPYACVHWVAVDQKSKRSGIATFIIKIFEKICLEKGTRWMRIDTHKGNLPMQSFITKMGFVPAGTIIFGGKEQFAYDKKIDGSNKEKKIKERLCCVCRARGDVKSMIRIAREKIANGGYIYFIDKKGNANGRGVYVCRMCIGKAVKTRALNRSFKANVGEDIYKQLSCINE